MQVRQNIAECISQADGCKPECVRFEGGQIITPVGQRSFTEAVQYAYGQRVQLWSDGFYATPKIHYDRTTLSGRPFYYFAYGAACSEVAVDTLTGEMKVLRADILHDVGRSLNPAIDIGQIEGGFVQGMGWLTSEELVFDDKGKLLTHAPSTYKIPVASDVPQDLRIALFDNVNRQDTIYRSKAVGEPPVMLGISVYCAILDALHGLAPQVPVPLDAPATPERILMAAEALRARRSS
jgi:xanthine dehydrogenase large subunit